MKILNVSGNQAWYEQLKLYKLEKGTFNQRFKSAIAKWYKKNLKCQAYGQGNFEKKPLTPEQEGLLIAENNLNNLGRKFDRAFDRLFS